MARISYGSVTHNSAYVLIVELNTASTYTQVYISCNGQTSPNLAPASGSSSSDGWVITGLSPNTTYAVSYTLLTAAGSTGSGGTTITTAPPPRPSNWSWSSSMVYGQPVNITANEWNSFCNKINEFRAYKGLSNYSFTTVYAGNIISASQLNQAITAMSPMTTTPALQSSGGNATVNFFINLRTFLNSIT